MQRYEKNKNYYNVPRFAKISRKNRRVRVKFRKVITCVSCKEILTLHAFKLRQKSV